VTRSSGCDATTNTTADRLWIGTIAAAAWIATIAWGRALGNGPGPMGLNLVAFVGMWAVMMTAMMLPSFTGSLAMIPGYLIVWAAVGIPAYAAVVGAQHLTDHHPGVATALAAGLFVAAGLYQLSPTKRRSLERCKTRVVVDAPLRAGMRYALWCLECSWAAMSLLIAVGFMNLAAMVAITLVLYAERRLLPGRTFRSLTAAAAVGFAVIIAFSPSVAAGMHQMPHMSRMM
jgi:predicted metal-binding membrane protein